MKTLRVQKAELSRNPRQLTFWFLACFAPCAAASRTPQLGDSDPAAHAGLLAVRPPLQFSLCGNFGGLRSAVPVNPNFLRGNAITCQKPLAGTAGLEPACTWVKDTCLTGRHPNVYSVRTEGRPCCPRPFSELDALLLRVGTTCLRQLSAFWDHSRGADL